jgi:PAS domain S-box-containing protein
MEHLHALLSTQFLPHGSCYLWNPALIWLHTISDSLIALSYYAIPVELTYFTRNRRNLPFKWIFWMFVVFIFGCGTTHVLEVVNVVTPAYWLTGVVKAVTAIASVATAVALVWLIPRALALEGEEKFRALFESAPDAMLLLGSDGKIALINAQTEALFGYTRGELVGQPIEMLMPPHFRERHPALRQHYFSAPQPRPMGSGVDLYGLRRDGSEFAAEISLSPIAIHSGTLVSAAIRDISARKRIEEENLRRLHEASRLKSEFIANMSHELRTPLNTVMGFASLIQSGKAGAVSELQKEFLGDILNSAQHLLHLISDILDVAKIEAGKMKFDPEPIALAALIEEMRDAMQVLAAEKHIVLSAEADPAIGTVTLDRARLRQVLYNYLSNAIKFTPEHGHIALRVTPEGAEAFRIEVEDTGIGIRAEHLAHLFADFQQLDGGSAKKYEGTGLGLSLTKRIVEAQGGSVGVTSLPNVGSTFWAVLPRSMEDSSARILDRLGKAEAESDPEVLVIEADPRQRGWLAQILREAGYDVQAVASGAGALSLCEQRAFSAITLPLLMSNGGGLEVLAQIRATALNRMVPVVAVTVSIEGRGSASFAIDDLIVNPTDDIIGELLKRSAVVPGDDPILMVDDNRESLAMKEATLTRLGYRPVSCRNRHEAIAAIERSMPAAIILNLFMAEMRGLEMLGELRRIPLVCRVPVIGWTRGELSKNDREGLLIAAPTTVLRGQTDIQAKLEEMRPHLQHSMRSRNHATHAHEA